MFNRYYQQELQNLRELATEFSKLHPAAAPMLSNQSADPDVERLLEGVAFLTGLMRQKLDDELPEIVRGLMDVVLPHYLRPIPAASVVVFTPKPSLMESIKVPAGTSLRSVPLEDTECVRLAADTDLSLASGEKMSMCAGKLAVHAGSGEAVIERMSFVSRTFHSRIKRIKLVANTVENTFRRLTQRLQDAFRFVEDHEEIQTGSTRHLVEDTLTVNAKNAVHMAEEVVTINAEQVHLG